MQQTQRNCLFLFHTFFFLEKKHEASITLNATGPTTVWSNIRVLFCAASLREEEQRTHFFLMSHLAISFIVKLAVLQCQTPTDRDIT